ncbi:MAG: 50S ribosomal protein L11 methyltransferase [Bacillota bacterium]|nr:50S ribosomal protein L11 methyltransferase [Bacillota bacterium]
MDYIKIKVHTDASQIDRANRIFLEQGVSGTEIYNPSDPDFQKPESHSWDFFGDEVFRDGLEDIYVTGYVEDGCDLDALIQSFVDDGFSRDRIETEPIASQNWEESWKQYFHPIRIEDLLILPSWEPIPAGDYRAIVTIDPGEAFGTGTHETTAMCLQHLKAELKAGDRVLDIGTGSGILAIAAAKLGASSVTAIDIDKRAVETAAENIARNQVTSRIDLRLGDLTEGIDGTFDRIVANIVADAIVVLAPHVAPLLAHGGVFIASGILDTKADAVSAALTEAGFGALAIHRMHEWVCIVARRQ